MEDTLREQDIRILYISGIGIYKPKQIGFLLTEINYFLSECKGRYF